MARTQAQPLVPILLLVSLFLLPALSEFVRHDECDSRLYPITLTSVDISPDRINPTSAVTITINAQTGSNINFPNQEIAMTIKGQNSGIFSERRYSLCDITKCPVGIGPIELTFPKISDDGRGNDVQVEISYNVVGKATSFMCIRFQY